MLNIAGMFFKDLFEGSKGRVCEWGRPDITKEADEAVVNITMHGLITCNFDKNLQISITDQVWKRNTIL